MTWFTNEQTTPTVINENINDTIFVYRVTRIAVCVTVHFTIISGNDDNHFFIDNTGKIYTNPTTPLDFEKKNNYSLVVRALYKNDTSGDYSIQATPADTVVNITVADLNEAPYWDLMSLDIELCHNISTGDGIHTLEAVDPDTMPSIVYNSGSGPNDLFYTNTTTGEIVKGSADLSSSSEYEFNVTVSDRNESTLISDHDAVLQITVRWCDVRRAEFPQPLVRNFTVMENDNTFTYAFLSFYHFFFVFFFLE